MEKIKVVVQGEINYPVLWRENPLAETEPCPFCSKPHTHGDGDGHRWDHCSSPEIVGKKWKSSVVIDGLECRADDGYVVHSHSQEPSWESRRAKRA